MVDYIHFYSAHSRKPFSSCLCIMPGSPCLYHWLFSTPAACRASYCRPAFKAYWLCFSARHFYESILPVFCNYKRIKARAFYEYSPISRLCFNIENRASFGNFLELQDISYVQFRGFSYFNCLPHKDSFCSDKIIVHVVFKHHISKNVSPSGILEQ